MANPFGLHYDGDLRRIYEVPENSSFVTDGSGYRIYTPDFQPYVSATISTTYLWSRTVDYLSVTDWSTIPMSKKGGAFRYTDTATATDVFATFDLRLIHNWEFVPANFPDNKFTINGNLFGDEATGRDFDTARVTAIGVSPRINFADSLQVTQSGSGLTPEQSAMLDELWKIHGLDPIAPLTATPASRVAGAIDQTISGDGKTTSTVTRNP